MLDNSKQKIDILVNNTAVGLVKHLGSITTEDFESVYNLNVRGSLLMTQAAAGRIINISCARCGFPGLSVYCSSKAAIERLTRCWATELDRNGSTVNCVNPGTIQTALVETSRKIL
jgi:3-oxoacyl-[acyl-carrier protein] reductase